MLDKILSLFNRRQLNPEAGIGPAFAPAPGPYLQDLPPPIFAISAKLRTVFGLQRPQFDSLIVDPLVKLVNLIGAEPCEGHSSFSSSYGLAELCAKTALYAFQSAGGAVFCRDSDPLQRRELEPVWQYAAFVAGLLYAYRMNAKSSGVIESMYQDFFNESSTAILSRDARILPTSLAAAVELPFNGSDRLRDIVRNTYLRLTGAFDSDRIDVMDLPPVFRTPLDLIVAKTSAEGLEPSAQFDPPAVSLTPLEGTLVKYAASAISELFGGEVWKVNQPKSRVWVANDGLFVIWPPAVNDITRIFRRDGIPGIPATHEAFAKLLIRASKASRFSNDAIYAPICVPNDSRVFDALVITDEAWFWGRQNIEYTRLDVNLIQNCADTGL